MKKIIKIGCMVVIALLMMGCKQEKKPKYIFYFIGDGMGVNQVLATQMYLAELEGRIGTTALSFTQFPVQTMVSTYSRYNGVTDSAAAGTALSTGEKTKNGSIGMDSLLQEPIYSVAVDAKEAGLKVGVATTVSIDHATPAVFYAHQPKRSMGYEIARDAVESGYEFFAGAGFSQVEKDTLPNVIPILKEAGYYIAHGYEDYKANRAQEKVILLQEDEMKSLPFAIDRKDDLTLTEITEAAIDYLGKDEKGFFVMIEGGLIDWACHSNDGATVIRETIDFAEAIGKAVEFYNAHKDETLIVVTADHETGGIVLGTGKYALNLQALQHQKISLHELTKKMGEKRKAGELANWEEVKEMLKCALGLWEEVPMNEDDEAKLKAVYDESFGKKKGELVHNLYGDHEKMAQEAVAMLNKKALLGWTSYGHSGGFVPVYAIGVGAERFGSVRDNIDIPNTIRELIVKKK